MRTTRATAIRRMRVTSFVASEVAGSSPGPLAILRSQELDVPEAHGQSARMHLADSPPHVRRELSRQTVAHVVARRSKVAHAGQDVLERRGVKEIEATQIVVRVRRAMAPLLEQ